MRDLKLELKLLSAGAPLKTQAPPPPTPHPSHPTPPAVQYGNITFDLDQMAIFYQVPFNCSIGGMDTYAPVASGAVDGACWALSRGSWVPGWHACPCPAHSVAAAGVAAGIERGRCVQETDAQALGSLWRTL